MIPNFLILPKKQANPYCLVKLKVTIQKQMDRSLTDFIQILETFLRHFMFILMQFVLVHYVSCIMKLKTSVFWNLQEKQQNGSLRCLKEKMTNVLDLKSFLVRMKNQIRSIPTNL